MVGYGRQLFEAVRQVGAEGVVSKRRGSLYRETGRATGLRPNEDAYVKLWETIKERGVPARWVGRTYRYWYCGDGWRYWCMGPKWPY